MNNRKEIREHYKRLTPLILEQSAVKNTRWVDPYCHIDWASNFTPIEQDMWNAVRCFGKAPMYPQYPVGNYFVDFGNPATKIAIECDGKEWHTDTNKDYLRDKVLLEMGWIVYRINGSDCVRPEIEVTDDTDEREVYRSLEHYYLNTAIGLVKAISIFHYNFYPFYPRIDDIVLACECLRKRISIKEKHHEVVLDMIMQKYYSEID